MPFLDGLKVRLSLVHGYGVFAQRPFKKGEIVVYGDGVLFRESDEFDDEYALILPGYESKDDGSEGDPLYYDLTCQTRWINHSCGPNTEVDTSWDRETKSAKAWWVALRDIEVGEEIAYDYAFSAHLAIPCLCKDKGCRGLIVDEEEIHEVPLAMQKFISPHFLAKPDKAEFIVEVSDEEPLPTTLSLL